MMKSALLYFLATLAPAPTSSLAPSELAPFGVAEVLYAVEPLGVGIYSCAVADLDGDGINEVVFVGLDDIISTSVSRFWVAKYDPSSTDNNKFKIVQYWRQEKEVVAMIVTDIDGDGKSDLVVGSTAGVEYTLDFFNMDPCCPEEATVTVHSRGTSQGISLVDLDGDGKLDIITSYKQESVHWMRNIGWGKHWVRTHLSTTELCGVHAMMAADVDGDGEVEIVVGGDEFPLSYLKHQPGKPLHVQENWNIQFLSDETSGLECEGENWGGARYYCAADFDGDGIIDLASTFKNWVEVSVALYPGGNGIGYAKTWGSRVDLLQREGTVHGMTCTDWTDNGWVDIIVTNRAKNEIILIENLGNGNFAEPQRIKTDEPGMGCVFPTKIVSGDVDGDGLTDLVISCKKSGVIIWIPGSSRNPGLSVSSSNIFSNTKIINTD